MSCFNPVLFFSVRGRVQIRALRGYGNRQCDQITGTFRGDPRVVQQQATTCWGKRQRFLHMLLLAAAVVVVPQPVACNLQPACSLPYPPPLVM